MKKNEIKVKWNINFTRFELKNRASIVGIIDVVVDEKTQKEMLKVNIIFNVSTNKTCLIDIQEKKLLLNIDTTEGFIDSVIIEKYIMSNIIEYVDIIKKSNRKGN